MGVVLTDKQVRDRIREVEEKDPLAATLIRLDEIDHVYVAGNERETFLNVVAAVSKLLDRKKLLETES